MANTNKLCSFFLTLFLLALSINAFSDVPPQQKYYLVGHSHIDIAWKWRWKETVQVVHDTFKTAIRLLKTYKDMHYLQSSAQMYQWTEENSPDLFEDIKALVKEGRWEIVGGSWVESDMNLPSGEALTRQFLYGKRYFLEKFGVDVKLAFYPDTFGFAGSVPQILKKSGIDYFSSSKLRWNRTHKPDKNILYWESNDGSRVSAILTPSAYETRIMEPDLTFAEQLMFYHHPDAPYTSILMGVGDHGGAVPEGDIKLLHKWQKEFAGKRTYEFRRYDDTLKGYFDSGMKIPVVKDELYLEYHQGTYTTHGALKAANRKTEVMLEDLEKISVFSYSKYPNDFLDIAWKAALMDQFHDILPGSGISDVVKDALTDYRRITVVGNSFMENALKGISTYVDTLTPGKAHGLLSGVPLFIFNTLSWDRTELIELKLSPVESTINYNVYDSTGTTVPSSKSGDSLLFHATLPQMGYTVYYLVEDKRVSSNLKVAQAKKLEPIIYIDPKTGAGIMENEFYRISINMKTGNLQSIFAKNLNREILSSAREGNLLQVREDSDSKFPAWNISYKGDIKYFADKPHFDVLRNDDFGGEVEITRKVGFLRRIFKQKISLFRGNPLIYFKTDLDYHISNSLLKVGFAFNLSNKSKRAFYDSPYGFIMRTHDGTKDDFEVSGQKWVTLQNDDNSFGVALLNDSKYGFDVGPVEDKENLNQLRMSLVKNASTPVWITSLGIGIQTDSGMHSINYALYPYAGTWEKSHISKKAMEFNYKPYLQRSTLHEGILPLSKSMMKISSSGNGSGAVISAIKKPYETSNGYDAVIRIFESENSDSTVNLAFPDKKIAKLVETDLIERPLGEPIDIGASGYTFDLKKNEIRTLMIKFLGN